MTEQMIAADTLKAIRKARKLGRPRLAKLSGLTERQITRLEGGAPLKGTMKPDTLSRIACALSVPECVLTGALPLSDDDLQPAASTTCTSGCCG